MPAIYQISPLDDTRWKPFLQRHPDASVFHSEEWLRTLQDTYGFTPAAFTTSAPGSELQNALLFCRVASLLTGDRLVSLPFSDHCAPLLSDANDLALLVDAIASQLTGTRIRYAELRPTQPLPESGPPHITRTYRSHRLNLTPQLSDIYGGFHKSCVARKIRRAERENLVYKKGCGDQYFPEFWKLYIATRRRHSAPPQPPSWFHNLAAEFRQAATIHLAVQGDQPIAAILTLEFKDTLTYKYGCSDPRFHSLGGTHLLFWRAIQDAKMRGLRFFDLGRSDPSNEGLVCFKDRWGAPGCDLVYSKFTARPSSHPRHHGGRDSYSTLLARRVLSGLPDSLFAATGALLYKHIA